MTFVRGVTNRIGTPGHDKLAIFFGNDLVRSSSTISPARRPAT